jgi:hypothetical protein
MVRYESEVVSDSVNRLFYMHCRYSCQAADLKAYVHVGPHKTGSTHVQNFLQSIAENLARKNYHWPHYENNLNFDTKDLSEFGNNLSEGKSLDQGRGEAAVKFIEQCRREKRNIIMSSEALDDLTAEQVQTLVATLEGFEVNIM